VREELFVWGFLAAVYSVTLALLLEPLLALGTGLQLDFFTLWLWTVGSLVLPALLQLLPGAVPDAVAGTGRWIAGALAPALGRRVPGPGSLARLYLRHESRRLAPWVGVALAGAAAAAFPVDRNSLWLVFSQVPLQRALFGVPAWARLAHFRDPRAGGRHLLGALAASQLLQAAAASVVGFCVTGWGFGVWAKLSWAALAGALGGCAVALEGDAGRPWLVSFLSLAAGVVAALLTYAWPWFALAVAPVFISMSRAVEGRLRSIEHPDEDSFIS
jgi:hypothetical protein